MNWRRVVAVGISGLLATMASLVVVTFWLPAEIALRTSRQLAAPPDAVLPLLTSHDGLTRWWTVAAEEMAEKGYELPMSPVDGPSSGPGTRFVFGTPEAPMEEWEILSVTGDRVVYDVDFQVFRVERALVLEPRDGGTHLTWTETGTIDNPLFRWFTVLMPEETTLTNFQMAMAALDAAATK